MRQLPLYPSRQTPIEAVEPREPTRDCRRCSLGESQIRTVCMEPAGEPGGLLVVGEHPGKIEDAVARHFVNPSGARLRGLIEEIWRGPVAYDYAVRCFPAVDAKKATAKATVRCRPYLRDTIDRMKPQRILAVGEIAAKALLGSSPPLVTTRRAYGWLGDPEVPVFMAPPLWEAARNRFVWRWLEEDVRWALTCDLGEDAEPPPWRSVVNVVSPDCIEEARRALYSCSFLAYDAEWAGVLYDPSFQLLCLALAPSDRDTAWIWDEAALRDRACLALLRTVLMDRGRPKISSNGKTDNLAIRWALGIRVQGERENRVDGDVRLWAKLVQPEGSGYLADLSHMVGMGGLKDDAELARKEAVKREERRLKKRQAAQSGWWDDDEVVGGAKRLRDDHAALLLNRGKREKADRVAYALLPDEILLPYCARDAVATARLGRTVRTAIRDVGPLWYTWDQLVSRQAHALEQMEWWGIAVARDNIENLGRHVDTEVAVAQRRLRPYGEDFNVESPDQVADLLFRRLKLKPPKGTDKTAGGRYSVEADVLEKMSGEHPAVDDILEVRRLLGIKSRYVDGLLPYIRPDGRIHTNVLIDGTRSGRPSSTNPNLFNIPKVDEDEVDALINLIKACFIARPGYVLLQLDQSQVEPRVAGMIAGDEVLISIFESGKDLYLETARLVAPIFGVDPAVLDKKHHLRAYCKILWLALMYGMGDETVARQLKITVEEAKKLRSGVLGKFSSLAAAIRDSQRYTEKHGVAWTTWRGKRARRSPLWRVADVGDDRSVREAKGTAQRGAWNRRCQGSASDFCTDALCRVVEDIEDDGLPARLVLTIYDSLILEVREEEFEAVAQRCIELMTDYDVRPRLKVDAEVGRDWGHLYSLAEVQGGIAFARWAQAAFQTAKAKKTAASAQDSRRGET